MKFDKIIPGMTLFDVRRSTGLLRGKWDFWPVSIIEIDRENRRALSSWNSNKAKWIPESRLIKLRKNPPKNIYE